MIETYLTNFWNSLTIESIIKFFILYFFVIWIALVIWVTRDISNRTKNYFYQILSILIIVLFTPLGIFLYLLIRPRKTLFEKYYEEVEGNLDILGEMVEERIQKGGNTLSCPNCQSDIEEDFVLCPECLTQLKHECVSCKKGIRENWEVCPYCQTPQSGEKTAQKKKTPENQAAPKKTPPKKSSVSTEKHTKESDISPPKKEPKKTD